MPLVPEAGGTERITSLVAKGLTGRGHKCMGILVFDQSDGSMSYEGNPVKDLYGFLKEHNVDIVINQIAYARWLLDAFLSSGGERWHAEGGRIISCLHFDPRPASNLYYFMSVRSKTARVCFNIVKSALLYPYYRRQQDKECGKVFNWVYDHSDRYVTLSPTHFPYFKRVTARSSYERLEAINNPLTFDDIASEDIVDEKKKVVLICSRMDEYQKRISLALRAWKRVQDQPEAKEWTLKILGTGPDLDKYKDFVSKSRISGVVFEGRQSPEPYYREASVFLMTSTGIEGWGLTLTESLQRGVVPVVMNTCAVYSEIIENGVNGYLTPGSDIESFAAHLLSLMCSPQHLRLMQLNALRSASRFTLEKTMTKWDKIIDKIQQHA